MLSFLLSFFRKKTVDSVLRTFTRTLTDLDEVMQKRNALIVKNEKRMAKLVKASNAAEAEHKRAEVVYGRIKALLEG